MQWNGMQEYELLLRRGQQFPPSFAEAGPYTLNSSARAPRRGTETQKLVWCGA